MKAVAQRVLGKASLPLEFWIGRGKPINPYLKGRELVLSMNSTKKSKEKRKPSEVVDDDFE